MKIQQSSERNASLSEINIIPFVDIMLVLLIIFMVTAPMLQEGIEINLPEVSAASVDMSDEDFVLSIDQLGQIYINEKKEDKFSLISIEERLMDAFKEKKDKTLFLKADESIKYGYIMEVMAACRRAGVEKIGMITHTNEDEEASKKKHALNN
ncbi:MAG: protein TolR [Deltaproteobacteria bacterium]|nr:protein TolR [Deltaproteobacteria bacterium]